MIEGIRAMAQARRQGIGYAFADADGWRRAHSGRAGEGLSSMWNSAGGRARREARATVYLIGILIAAVFVARLVVLS